MIRDQVQCDHCGKIHEVSRYTQQSPLIEPKPLNVPLMVNGHRIYLDFCDEDCLRGMLIKRNDALILAGKQPAPPKA